MNDNDKWECNSFAVTLTATLVYRAIAFRSKSITAKLLLAQFIIYRIDLSFERAGPLEFYSNIQIQMQIFELIFNIKHRIKVNRTPLGRTR